MHLLKLDVDKRSTMSWQRLQNFLNNNKYNIQYYYIQSIRFKYQIKFTDFWVPAV